MNALSDSDLAWLDKHANDDPKKLMLRYHGDAHTSWLALQLECRRKARGKIDSEVSSRIVFPNTLAVEQSTSSEIATLHTELLKGASSALDMTAGLGSDAFALARSGCHVTACDLKEENVEAGNINAATLGLSDKIQFECTDSIERLREASPGEFDLAVVDPARRASSGKRLHALADCSPDVNEILPLAATRVKRLFIKASPMLDISATLRELSPYPADIHLYGTKTECKELCADIIFDRPVGEQTKIFCHTVGMPDFNFTLEEEATAHPVYRLPEIGDTIFEPYPSVIKGGAFHLLSAQTGTAAISPISHLYSLPANQAAITPFPGRPWRVQLVTEPSKQALKEIASRWPHLSVATRGFPTDADTLRKRLKVKESAGDMKLWGVTDSNNKPMLVVASAI